MNADNIRQGCDLIEEGMRKLSSGPLDYYLRTLTDCYALLIDRFAPFKVGDKVILTETPTLEKNSGWWTSRHFLVKGEAGVVREIHADGEGFSAAVEFDNETWIPEWDFPTQGIKKGVPQVPDAKHTFHFGERWLVKAPQSN